MLDRSHWFGAKRVAKNVLNVRPINAAIVGVLRYAPVTPTLARVPVSAPEVRGRVADVSYVLTNPSRCSIAKELFWGRGQRVKPDERLSLELFAGLSKHADVIFDIGANTGIFSIVAALSNAHARVEAFEIVPEVFEILFRNVVRNDIATQVTCHFVGVDKDGLTIRIPSTEEYSSLPLSVSATTKSVGGARVGFRSLDTLCAPLESGTRLLIKIDVEATEAALFANGWQAIKRLRPWMVCEILVGAPGTDDLSRRLTAAGYTLFRITDRGLCEAGVVVADARFHDWLFAPVSRAEVAQITGTYVF